MPCPNHDHRPWPKSGKHRLLIEACETQCGWCEYKTGHANNLRVHARRHIANPKNETLKDIAVVVGKAGRSRVALRSEGTSSPRGTTESISQLPSPSLGPRSDPMQDTNIQHNDMAPTYGYLLFRTHVLEEELRRHGLKIPLLPEVDPGQRQMQLARWQRDRMPPPPLRQPQPSPTAPPISPHTRVMREDERRESRKPSNMRISVRPETLLTSSNSRRPPQNEELVRDYQTGISRALERDKSDTETRFPSTLLQHPEALGYRGGNNHNVEPNPFEESFAFRESSLRTGLGSGGAWT